MTTQCNLSHPRDLFRRARIKARVPCSPINRGVPQHIPHQFTIQISATNLFPFSISGFSRLQGGGYFDITITIIIFRQEPSPSPTCFHNLDYLWSRIQGVVVSRFSLYPYGVFELAFKLYLFVA